MNLKNLIFGMVAVCMFGAFGAGVYADVALDNGAGFDNDYPDGLYNNPVGARDDFKWDASVGMMVLYTPKYDGSDEYQSLYMPAVNLEYGPFYASVAQGVGVYLPLNSSRTFIISPAIRWRTTRNLGDARDIFEYISDIRPTATVNTILKLDPFIFNVRATTGLISDNMGANYNLGAAWRRDVTARMNLSLYTTLIYADRDYNNTYFGVSHRTGLKYGFDEFDASSGWRSVDVGAVIKYFVTEHVAIDFMAEYLRLIGVAAKSPVTVDKNQFLFGIGASYHF